MNSIVFRDSIIDSKKLKGFVIAQEVSRWLPTAAARLRAQADHMGFVVDKVALGQVFS
jgi:hypothetical protein